MTTSIDILPLAVALLAASAPTAVGDLLRAWRGKRRLSQLEVGVTAGVSARHT